MSLDLTKQLKMADIEDIDKRFASSDEILETYTTSLSADQTNTFTFQDIAQVSKPITLSQDKNEDILTDESISSVNKTIMTKVLGYEPKNNDDITKAIDKISIDLKKSTNTFLSSLIMFINKDDFKAISFNNNNNNNINSSNNSNNNTSNIINNKDKFGVLYQKNGKTEKDLQKHLNNIASLDSLYLDDREVSDAITSTKDINFLENMNTNGYKTFIADDVSAEYLSSNEDSNILNDMKNMMSNTLKYATDICKDLVDILNTMITDIADLMKSIIKFLTSALKTGSTLFLKDILECFDKIKDLIFKPDNAQAIGKQIEQKGDLNSLKVLLDQNRPDRYNYKKLLYNTIKNAPDVNNSIYNDIKNTFNIDDNEDFISFKKPKISDTTNNLINDIGESIFDINKIKTNSNMGDIILTQYDEDDSKNSNFIKSIPLSFLV